MDLKRILKEKILDYDKEQERLDKMWEEISNLKPTNMNNHEFNRLLQEARYETKQKNLDHEMIENFRQNNPIKVKEWIYKGADKQKLYNFVENSDSFNLSMYQQWLLEDLHNTKKEKNFPFIYDREISDVKTITEDELECLFNKFEKKIEFTSDEMDIFLFEDKESKMIIAINNSSANMWTEEFNEKEMAVRYLQGEDIEKLREEECKYEVCIYETKEDYKQGEPFQLNVYSDFKEAKRDLKRSIKFNHYFSGNIINQENGKEEFCFYLNSEECLQEDALEESEEL